MKRNEQHGNVQADSQQLVGAGHLRGLITNEQEIFKFARVLLHKQIDAKHENIETQDRDNQSDNHHHGYHHTKEVGCLLGIQLVVLDFIAFAVEIFHELPVTGIAHVYDQACGGMDISRCIDLITPVHERLGDKN